MTMIFKQLSNHLASAHNHVSRFVSNSLINSFESILCLENRALILFGLVYVFTKRAHAHAQALVDAKAERVARRWRQMYRWFRLKLAFGHWSALKMRWALQQVCTYVWFYI
jgi:hypothetical protein